MTRNEPESPLLESIKPRDEATQKRRERFEERQTLLAGSNAGPCRTLLTGALDIEDSGILSCGVDLERFIFFSRSGDTAIDGGCNKPPLAVQAGCPPDCWPGAFASTEKR